MTSSDSKVSKVEAHFKTLSSAASSINAVSEDFANTVTALDESLKRLNIGLTVWVTFRCWNDSDKPFLYTNEQIGYSKVKDTWGIAVRRVCGDVSRESEVTDDLWLFNDAPRRLRLLAVDKMPEVIEALSVAASDTAKTIEKKTAEVRELAGIIEAISNAQKRESSPWAAAANSPTKSVIPRAPTNSVVPPAPPTKSVIPPAPLDKAKKSISSSVPFSSLKEVK